MKARARIVVLTGTAAAAAAIVVAFSGFATAAQQRQPVRNATRAQPRLRTTRLPTDRKLSAHFKILRQDVGSRERNQAHAASASASGGPLLSPGVVVRFQLNLSGIKLITTSSGPVWVVPGAAGACILAGQAAATPQPVPGENFIGCDSATAMLADGLMVEGGQTGAEVVAGLVPDGTTNVTITPQQGNAVTVPVVNGVFRADAPNQAFSVTPVGLPGKPASNF